MAKALQPPLQELLRRLLLLMLPELLLGLSCAPVKASHAESASPAAAAAADTFMVLLMGPSQASTKSGRRGVCFAGAAALVAAAVRAGGAGDWPSQKREVPRLPSRALMQSELMVQACKGGRQQHGR